MKLIDSGETKTFIECDCGTEGVHVSSNYDVHETNPELTEDGTGIIVQQDYYMSFYGYGHIRKPNLWWRIRQAIRILLKGTPYTDMILMTPEEAMRLSNFIRDNLIVTKPTQHEYQQPTQDS